MANAHDHVCGSTTALVSTEAPRHQNSRPGQRRPIRLSPELIVSQNLPRPGEKTLPLERVTPWYTAPVLDLTLSPMDQPSKSIYAPLLRMAS